MEKHAETIIPPLWCQICILKLNEISIYNIWGWGYKRGVACFVLLLVTKLDVAVVREYRVIKLLRLEEAEKIAVKVWPLWMGLRDGEHPCNKTIQ